MFKRINTSNRIDTTTNIKMEVATTTIAAITIIIIEITPTSNTTITINILCSSIKCGHNNKVNLHLII